MIWALQHMSTAARQHTTVHTHTHTHNSTFAQSHTVYCTAPPPPPLTPPRESTTSHTASHAPSGKTCSRSPSRSATIALPPRRIRFVSRRRLRLDRPVVRNFLGTPSELFLLRAFFIANSFTDNVVGLYNSFYPLHWHSPPLISR